MSGDATLSAKHFQKTDSANPDFLVGYAADTEPGTSTVTLKARDGEMTTVKARNPDNLNRVSVGDLVDITYTEALGISVETPKT